MGGKCSSTVNTDGGSSITARDKKLVHSTWHKLYRQWENKYGTDFMLRLFKNQPAIRQKFKTLTKLSEEELPNSPTLNAHVIVFGTTVTTWVDKLDDTETLVALIQKMTDSHVVRGINDVTLLKAALQDLLQFITDTLGLSPTQISAWNKIANLIASVIEERMKEFQ